MPNIDNKTDDVPMLPPARRRRASSAKAEDAPPPQNKPVELEDETAIPDGVEAAIRVTKETTYKTNAKPTSAPPTPPLITPPLRPSFNPANGLPPNSYAGNNNGFTSRASSLFDNARANFSAPADDNFADELEEFFNEWQDEQNIYVCAVRLTDTQYAATVPYKEFSPLRLSPFPFSPASFISDIQTANNNSGGRFKIFCCDYMMRPLQGKRIEQIIIPNPPTPKQNAQTFAGNNSGGELANVLAKMLDMQQKNADEIKQILQQKPQTNESDAFMRKIMELQIMKMMDAPPVVQNGLNQEDAQALALAKNPAYIAAQTALLAKTLESVINTNPNAPQELTTLDKVMKVVETNPSIVDRAAGLAERAMQLFASKFATVQEPDADFVDADEPSEPDKAEIYVNRFLLYLRSDEPLTMDNPLFQELRAEFATQFTGILFMVKAMSFDKLLLEIVKRYPDAAAIMETEDRTLLRLKELHEIAKK